MSSNEANNSPKAKMSQSNLADPTQRLFRIGDLVYGPDGLVLVMEVDDEAGTASCISMCSRFVKKYAFSQIGLVECDAHGWVPVDKTYETGDIVEFKTGTKLRTGVIYASGKGYWTVIKPADSFDGIAIPMYTEVLVSSKDICGYASQLTQSLFRLRWNDVQKQSLLSVVERAEQEPADGLQVGCEDECDDPEDYVDRFSRLVKKLI
jgi:hypothetical protein